MASRYLKKRNIDPLYYGPPNWGPPEDQLDFIYERLLYRDPPYSNQFPKDLFKTTPSSLTTDTYQQAKQQILQQDRILQQRLQQEHNRTRRCASEFESDLSSQNLEQSRRNSLQHVKTNGSRVVRPSQSQLLVNNKHFKTDEVDARKADDFAVVHAKHAGCPGKDCFICRCKLPGEEDSGKLALSSRQDGDLTIKAQKMVQMKKFVRSAMQDQGN